MSQSRATHRVSQFAGLFLGLGLTLRSYYMRELLVCWLCFSIAFVSLTLVILVVALVCYAGKYFANWASKAARVTPKVALGAPEIQLKISLLKES